MDDDLLPLSRERAAELLERDLTVYMVQSGENPAMVFDREELEEQPSSVIFAVPRDEWEASEDFRQAVADRLNHQEKREKAFLDHGRDCFALYQLSFEKDTFLKKSPQVYNLFASTVKKLCQVPDSASRRLMADIRAAYKGREEQSIRDRQKAAQRSAQKKRRSFER